MTVQSIKLQVLRGEIFFASLFQDENSMKKKQTAIAKAKHTKPKTSEEFSSLYEKVRLILEESRSRAFRAVNTEMVRAYWLIGQAIVEEEQKGKRKADWGERVIRLLSERLTAEFGKGFTLTNLKYMRQFYLTFGKGHALRDQLIWTHYRLLLKVEKPEAHAFYETEAVEANWSTRQLERQINSFFYERAALSKQKQKLLAKSRSEAEQQTTIGFIKDPFVLIKVYFFEQLKNGEAFGVRLSWQPLSPTLVISQEGESCARAAALQNIPKFSGSDLCTRFNYLLRCFLLI
jgi:predicted nuclease of restriction endonuclease-like (RecB) superfamily